MKYLNSLRWKRVKESEIPYIYIKGIIKHIYGYEVKEDNIDEFIEKIDSYNNINEGFLLSAIEEHVYKKLRIFSMKDLMKYDEHPIKSTLNNKVFKQLFKQKNRINIDENEYYIGNLDTCYKVVKYNENGNIFEIKLACIRNSIYTEIQADGVQDEVSIDVYDSVKYIIDIEKELVLMFYNDIFEGNFNNNKEVTNRKKAFFNLFENVSNSNLVNYELTQNLLEYFYEYLKELNDNNIRKSISLIETFNKSGKANSVRSKASDFNHSEHRIKAIEYAIEKENHSIATIECVVNSNSIRLRNNGEIYLQDCTFQSEVMESVCKEFFRSYNPTKQIRECI